MNRIVSDCRACASAIIPLATLLLSACGGGTAATDAAHATTSATLATDSGQPCGIEGSGRAQAASCVPSADTVPPPSGPLWQGRFIGAVRIGATQYFGDALFTADGAVRLYVGGPYASDGTVQEVRPESSVQFVGKLEGSGSQASGSGIVVGQGCAVPVPGRFCGASTRASISVGVNYVGVAYGQIHGEIYLTTAAGDEVWSLDLQDLNNYYMLPASLPSLTALYQEKLAEFAGDGDTILSLDGAGRLFFQSAYSGCVGNGTLTPHLDGTVNVYDVVLDIEGCNAPRAYLNGAFDGLATTTPSSVWDYDSLLRMWLARIDGAVPPAALTTLAVPR